MGYTSHSRLDVKILYHTAINITIDDSKQSMVFDEVSYFSSVSQDSRYAHVFTWINSLREFLTCNLKNQKA